MFKNTLGRLNYNSNYSCHYNIASIIWPVIIITGLAVNFQIPNCCPSKMHKVGSNKSSATVCQISFWDIFLWVSYESESWVLISSAKGIHLPEYLPSNTDFTAQITVQTNIKMQWVIFSLVLRILSNMCLHVSVFSTLGFQP